MVDARTIGEDPEELREIAEQTTVFGRVSPEQKRALVQALQRNGHVVAMTGDGVNDALALKDADIGVAMGNGAQATKAVAQLVLLDGRFSHMPSVLAEGRRVIGNVERVANLFVAKNVMSLIAIISAALFALPFPFLPRHLTLVSAVTIGIPAFFLALGPEQAPLHPRLPAPGAAVRGAGRRRRRAGGAGLVPAGPQRRRRPAGVGVSGEDRVQRLASPTSSAGSRRPRRRSRCCSPRSGFWWCCPGRSGRGRRRWSVRWSAIAALAFITPLGQSFFNFSLTPTTLCGVPRWSARSARSASRSSTAPNRRCGRPPRTDAPRGPSDYRQTPLGGCHFRLFVMRIGIGLPEPCPRHAGHPPPDLGVRRPNNTAFSTLATIDRLAFANHDSLIALAAAAAVTERIELLTNILLLPTRNRCCWPRKRPPSPRSRMVGSPWASGWAAGRTTSPSPRPRSPIAGSGRIRCSRR